MKTFTSTSSDKTKKLISIINSRQATLEQLNQYNDMDDNSLLPKGEYRACIEYSEGSELQDMFTLTIIVNPENEQKTIEVWIPSEMVACEEARLATTDTGRYHDWRADFPPSITCAKNEKKEKLKEYETQAMNQYSAIAGIDWDSVKEVDNYYSEEYSYVFEWNLISPY